MQREREEKAEEAKIEREKKANDALIKNPRVAGWDITYKKDAFGDKDTAIASVINGGNMLVVRCLQGDVSFALGQIGFGQGRFSEGANFKIKYKIGQDNNIMDVSGSGLSDKVLQVNGMDKTDLDIFSEVKSADFRVSFSGVVFDMNFKFKNSDKVVHIIKHACKLN